MSGLFKAGQLVVSVHWSEEPIPLYNKTGTNVPFYEASDVRVIGHLEKSDIAIIIGTTRSGVDVYVVGPHGSGWTFGALLSVVT